MRFWLIMLIIVIFVSMVGWSFVNSLGISSTSLGISQQARGDLDVDLVAIRNMSFKPVVIKAKQGDKVTFVNQDLVDHLVVLEEQRSTLLHPGERYDFLMNQKGEFGYYCAIHPSMKGVVVVE